MVGESESQESWWGAGNEKHASEAVPQRVLVCSRIGPGG